MCCLTMSFDLHCIDIGDSPVQCRTAVDCTGNFTMMSARDCCVSNPGGLAYTIPGVEACQVCIGM